MSSGCHSVGRAVASATSGALFESSHWQIYIEHFFNANCIGKAKIMDKRGRKWSIVKTRGEIGLLAPLN